MAAAAVAHRQTGVPITTHTHAASQNGRDQLAFFREHGVDPESLVIGHCGDSEDLDYLRELMDAGATIGMDRFGMEHVLPDEIRVAHRARAAAPRLRRPDGALPRRGVLQPGDPAVLAGPDTPRTGTWRTSRGGSSRCCSTPGPRRRTSTGCWSAIPPGSSPRGHAS